jgi:hypothetical protein
LSTAFISEAIPRYSVAITRPGKRDNKPITVSASAVNVEWDVRKKQFWTERLVADAGGEVTLYGPDDRPIMKQACTGTSCEIVFQRGPTGTYQIRVYVPDHSIASDPADFVFAPAAPGTGSH